MVFLCGFAGKCEHSYGWNTPYLYKHSVYLLAFGALRSGLQHIEKGTNRHCDYSHNVFGKSSDLPHNSDIAHCFQECCVIQLFEVIKRMGK